MEDYNLNLIFLVQDWNLGCPIKGMFAERPRITTIVMPFQLLSKYYNICLFHSQFIQDHLEDGKEKADLGLEVPNYSRACPQLSVLVHVQNTILSARENDQNLITEGVAWINIIRIIVLSRHQLKQITWLHAGVWWQSSCSILTGLKAQVQILL